MREFLNSFTKLEFDKIKNHICRYTLSEIGREHLDRLTPSTSPDEIRLKLSLVSEMKNILESDEPPPLDNVIDVRTSLQRSTIENFILSPKELHAIAIVLKTGRNILSYFTRRKQLYPLLFKLISTIQQNKVLEYNISLAIDDEERVKDSASKELLAIRRQIVEKSSHLKKRLSSILGTMVEKEWAQDEIITTREGRMVIPVKVEHKNRIRGFIHNTSSSGATVYIEPTETLEVNNEICTLQFQEQKEIESILKELTEQIRSAREEILNIVRILGELDFIQAKAKYSLEIIGIEAVLKTAGKLKLYNARHPMLLHLHKREEVIPLNLEVGEEINTLVITGPNAGGKSVVLKTIGLLCLLHQSGCHIPVSSESEMRIFSDIFVDMGDEQSIENDLSSFSSHLKNLKFILDHADKDSLILVDEICSGTDPNEGASLAAAVLRSLSQADCSTIATTHHGALKTFAFETPRFQNAAMEFNLDTLTPTYNFRLGIPGSSYAIEMAERIQLPETVLEVSRNLKGSEANKLENLILDLEHKSQELASNLEEVKIEKNKLKESIFLYENRISSLEKEMKSIKSRALDEAELIVQKANVAIEKIVKEIKENAASTKVVRSAKSEIKKIDEEFNKMRGELTERDDPTRDFSIGDFVFLKGMGASGEIVEKLDADHYVVVTGDLRVKIHKRELKISERKPAMVKQVLGSSEERDVRFSLDLRGMYGDEAINAVEKFLDDAILTGAHRLELIHGKGTGALRRRVSDYLKSLPGIKSFKLGEWNQGGSGVTIVELE